MLRIYFMRHGETVWNRDRRYQGMTDIELSETGIKQAECVAERLKNIQIDKIYSSPLKRAMATAEPVAAVKGLEIIPDDRFREIHFGEWEGQTVPELIEKYGDTYKNFIRNPQIYGFPGEGSVQNVINRLKPGIDEIMEHDDGNVLIISHGGMIRLMIMYIMGLDDSWFTKMWIDNTALSTIEFREDRTVLLKLNDNTHLAALKDIH